MLDARPGIARAGIVSSKAEDSRRGDVLGQALFCRKEKANADQVIASAVVTVFAHDAEAAAAFVRDVLEFPTAQTGDGWLRFVSPTELSVHSGGDPGVAEGQHKLYLTCDDIERTTEQRKRKGVEFVDAKGDDGCGLITRFKVPGAGEVGLVQARRSA